MAERRSRNMVIMAGGVVLYTCAFVLYGLMDVLGLMPQELRSAGVTLPALFSRYYGDQNIDFIGYHVRRTTVTVLLHLCLPLAYCLGLYLVDPNLSLLSLQTSTSLLRLIWVLALSSCLLGVGVALHWSRQGWKRHPLVAQLSQLQQPWRHVAQSVNLEFRDIDKFVSVLGGSTVIVTDSWIVQSNVHTVNIIHQRDSVLNVSQADEHNLSFEGQSVQYLTINVNSINAKFKSFAIRLNALQYSQLRDKLQAPIRTARNVVIQQSLSDRFAAAFLEQVRRNGIYHIPPGSPPLENCVGCLQRLPQVKLQKRCAEPDEGNCRQCFCRPMWCLSCMSKWFAARQNQHQPETWMGSTAPCPMCRAQFCVLDVLVLHGVDLYRTV